MVHQQEFSIPTAGQGDMHDVTGQVAAAVAASGKTVSGTCEKIGFINSGPLHFQ